MKAKDVSELKRSVALEKSRAEKLQEELRTTWNNLDKVLENHVKHDQESKINAQQPMNNPPVQERSDEFIDQATEKF